MFEVVLGAQGYLVGSNKSVESSEISVVRASRYRVVFRKFQIFENEGKFLPVIVYENET